MIVSYRRSQGCEDGGAELDSWCLGAVLSNHRLAVSQILEPNDWSYDLLIAESTVDDMILPRNRLENG